MRRRGFLATLLALPFTCMEGPAAVPPSVLRTGTIWLHYGAMTPAGLIPLNGQMLDKMAYPALFDTIGYVYGRADKGRKFHLPDMRNHPDIPAGGRFVIKT